MKREIVLDIETTGLDFSSGDKIIEIACVELINKVVTGRLFHSYINVDININKRAFEIHGISKMFLKDKPSFKKISKSLLSFIRKSDIVAHNASFDVGFINNELQIHSLCKLNNQVIDTLKVAKVRFPNTLVNLNSLCRKFNIDTDERKKHGALTDAILLSKVYSKMTVVEFNKINITILKRFKKMTYNVNFLKNRQEMINKYDVNHYSDLVNNILHL